METVRTASFCFGVFYGFVAAGVIAMIASQIRQARVDRGRRNLPLDRLPDAAHPKLTSADIVKFSNAAVVRLVAWGILLVGFISVATAGLFYIVA